MKYNELIKILKEKQKETNQDNPNVEFFIDTFGTDGTLNSIEVCKSGEEKTIIICLESEDISI